MKLQVLFVTLINPIPSLPSIHFRFRLQLNQNPASYKFYYRIEVQPAKILLLPRDKNDNGHFLECYVQNRRIEKLSFIS